MARSASGTEKVAHRVAGGNLHANGASTPELPTTSPDGLCSLSPARRAGTPRWGYARLGLAQRAVIPQPGPQGRDNHVNPCGPKGRDTSAPPQNRIMPQSLSRVLIHLVFSTKNREPVLTGAIPTELHPYMAGTLDKLDCPSLRVGGMADHVHLLFGLSRTRTIASVVEAVKTSSSKWIKTKGVGGEFAGFHWQSGYGAFSVSQSDADAVVAYIRNQEKHHRKMTFQEEYRKLLERYQVSYDEQYVWD